MLAFMYEEKAFTPLRLAEYARAINSNVNPLMGEVRAMREHQFPIRPQCVYLGGAGEQFLAEGERLLRYSELPPDDVVISPTGKYTITGFFQRERRSFIWLRDGDALVAFRDPDFEAYQLLCKSTVAPERSLLMNPLGPRKWTMTTVLPKGFNERWFNPTEALAP